MELTYSGDTVVQLENINFIHVFFLIIIVAFGRVEGEKERQRERGEREAKSLRYIGFFCDFCSVARCLSI